MLGTPNHGSEFFTRHRGEVCTGYCPGLAEASGDLLPSSLALGRLNGILSPPDQECADSPLESLHHGSVRYYTVAGTKYNKLICPELKFWRRDCLATGNCDGDGVVEWRSARLRSLTATNNKCPQWRDVDVGEELSHARLFGLSTGVGTPYLESSLLAGHVINALKSGSATIDGSGCLPNSPSELLSTSLPDSSSNVYVEQLGILTASLQPGESDSLSVQVDPADTMAVVVRGSSATFLISLMDPDSTTYFAPDTSTTAWLHYVVEDSSRTKVFIVDLPAPGSWVLAVGAELGSVDVDISVEWVSVGSGTGLSTVVTPMGSDGDSLIVVAQFIGEAPVTSSATGSVVWPDGSMDPVPMADDGFGGDEVAGDHCYWGYVLAPDQHGAAEVVIRGTGTLLGGAEFERLNSQFVSLSYVPELRVESTTIEWSPQIPTTESLVDLGVRIRNLGFADAESLLVIATQTLTDQVLASAVTSIMAGDSTTVQLSWLPTVAGDNEIRIELADAVDGDPTDNFATVKIPVASSTQPVGILNPPEPGNRPLMLYPYPNPASKSVRLQYYLSDRGQVEVAVFDIQGRLVRQLVSAILDSGEHMVDWDGTSRTGVRVASGIYFMHVATSQDRATRKVLLIR